MSDAMNRYALKNIYKIEMYSENGGYSRAGEWEADMHGTYSKDNTAHIVRQLESMMQNVGGESGGESEHAAIKKAISILENA